MESWNARAKNPGRAITRGTSVSAAVLDVWNTEEALRGFRNHPSGEEFHWEREGHQAQIAISDYISTTRLTWKWNTRSSLRNWNIGSPCLSYKILFMACVFRAKYIYIYICTKKDEDVLLFL